MIVRVAVFWHWDPYKNYPGGIGRFIEDIISNAPSNFEFTIFAMSNSPERFKQTANLDVNGKNCKIVFLNKKKVFRNKVIPLRLIYTFLTWRFFKKNNMKGFVFHFHGIEPLLSLPRKSKNKNILFLHSSPSRRWKMNSGSNWRFMPSSLYYYLEDLALTQTNNIFFVNRACYLEYLDKLSFRKQDLTLITTWYNPALHFPPNNQGERNTIMSSVKAKLKIENHTKLILYFGRYEEVKDPLILLDAMRHVISRIPNCHLLMIGGGTLEEKMKQYIFENDLNSKVTVLGIQKKDEIREYLWASELSVLPSKDEGMSMAINESLACGRPVIGFDVGEIRQVIKSDKVGTVVTQRSSEELAQAISNLLDSDESDEYRTQQCCKAINEYKPEKALLPLYNTCEELTKNISS
ncbi:MAG: glycosyltransferase [Gammaproteobacteria bacterium]|nr:glycosyltransferase [Gammaproteobacteria bacterium]